MAEIEVGKPKIKHRRSFLPSCFGGFREVDGERESQAKIVGSGGRRTSRWPLLLFKFRTKNSATKTVPLDNLSILQKSQRKSVEKYSKPLKYDTKRRIPVKIDGKAVTARPVVASLSDQNVPADKYPKAKYETVQNTILENRSRLDPFDSLKDDPIHNKKTIIKQRSDLTETANNSDSPVNKLMNRQSSLPPPARSRPVHSTADHRTLRKRSSRKDDTLAGRFEPAVGMSVLIVVLAIMLLWGKLCAILCTSAWFYFIPCFRRIMKFTDAGTTGENHKSDSDKLINLDSNEYKKKVILEGLLERSKRRNHAGVS